MNIELRGINFFNKGAELMLRAIMCKVKEEMPDALFVMERSAYATRRRHLQNGIYTKFMFKSFSPLRYLAAVVPAFIYKRLHYIAEREIDVVLDSSGFAFGDIWGEKKAFERLGSDISKWKKQGKKIIMLPQAFGPFSDEELIKVMKNIIHNADLIYARDKISFTHLKQLCSDNKKIFCAPDFTNLIEGIVPSYFDNSKYQVAVIVNSKMADAAITGDAEFYINFLYKIIVMVGQLGFKPYFLIHEVKTDIGVVETINNKLVAKLPVVNEDDPLFVKGIISKSLAVITSRFHGLVSCLSQAIPCLTTNWGHKYEMLLQDYNYSEGLLDVHCDDQLLLAKVKAILTEPSRSRIIKNLEIESLKQKEVSRQMWRQVFSKMKARN